MINIYKEDDANLLLNLKIQDANMGNADEFKAELTRLSNTHQQKRLILNLQDVEYIDSSFLGAMVSVLKYVISLKSYIILVGLRKDIHNLLP